VNLRSWLLMPVFNDKDSNVYLFYVIYIYNKAYVVYNHRIVQSIPTSFEWISFSSLLSEFGNSAAFTMSSEN